MLLNAFRHAEMPTQQGIQRTYSSLPTNTPRFTPTNTLGLPTNTPRFTLHNLKI